MREWRWIDKGAWPAGPWQDGTYKDLAYVVGECIHLAAQLAAQ